MSHRFCNNFSNRVLPKKHSKQCVPNLSIAKSEELKIISLARANIEFNILMREVSEEKKRTLFALFCVTPSIRSGILSLKLRNISNANVNISSLAWGVKLGFLITSVQIAYGIMNNASEYF